MVVKHPVSIYVFGLYMMVSGAALMFMPNFFLHVFGLPPTDEVWPRLSGILLGILGGYYLVGARHKLRKFLFATVLGRLGFAAALCLFAVQGYGQALFLFAAIDIVGALWTLVEVKRA